MSVLEAPIILKLAPELAGILLSPEEFDAVEECDELYNYELVAWGTHRGTTTCRRRTCTKRSLRVSVAILPGPSSPGGGLRPHPA